MKYIHTAVFGVFVSIIAVALSGVAAAHVTVTPKEVPTATFQTFTVNVPTEKDIPTTSVKVAIPTGVEHVTPTQKAGWNVAVEEKNEMITAITWSGGTIDKGLRDEFTFSAQTPDTQTDLQWKAYQTYADDTVVSWDKAENNGGHDSNKPNEGPLSITKVTEETETTTTTQENNDIASIKQDVTRALSVAIMALALSVVSIILVTRKKS